MSLATIFAAMAVMAVNFGWQKADDGYEYLVQLEPETLELMQDGIGGPIDSHVPDGVHPIRRIRIVVGKAELPREELSASDDPKSETAIERSANWRPGDAAPAPDSRYATQPPAAAAPLSADALAEPLRTADDMVEKGFEKAVDGLDNTGQAIRGAMNNFGAGVQDQFNKSKEFLVGSSPNAASTAVSPNAGSPGTTGGTAPSWPAPTAASTNGGNPLLNLPPPPLMNSGEVAGTPPATSTPTGSNPAATGGFPAYVPQSSPFESAGQGPAAQPDNSSRLVPVTSESTSAEPAKVPAWAPWPEPVNDPKKPFVEFPPANPPASSPKALSPQPTELANGNGMQPTSVNKPELSSSNPANGQSLGGWALAIIGLAGSVGCNFFLGFSYLDIRNKYRAALRRTSRSFGRPAASA